MTTNQEARHQDLRDSTSTARGMTADWHALWDGASVADGTFNERLLAWINSELGTSYTNLPGAMHAYAANGGFANWHSINVIESGPSYAVNNNEPDTVADFAGVLNSGTEYYRVGGSETTFADMFTHARSSNATMVDSDGSLKWAPHNLLDYSEDFTSWSSVNTVETADTETAPDGTTTADTVAVGSTGAFRYAHRSPTLTQGATYTFKVWLKYKNCQWIWLLGETSSDAFVYFDVQNGVVGTTAAGVTTSIVADSGGYWCSITFTKTSATKAEQIGFGFGDGDNDVNATAGQDVYAWGAHAYRSDLGGMVNNWDRSPADSYVPTTSAAVYLPRRNHYRYNGFDYTKKGLLLESAAATNLVPHSNTFSSGWSITATDSVSISAGAATGPDGTSSATKLVESVDNEEHSIVSTVLGSAATHTFSVFAKAAERNWIILGGTAATDAAWFNLSTGTVGTQQVNVISARIEDVGNGWYRCSVTSTAAGVGSLAIFLATADNTVNYDGDGTSGLLIYGAQLEVGSVPTSYIPTSGSTATRAAETLTIAGANMAYSATAMSFQMQGEYNFADNNSGAEGQWLRWRADANNYIEERLATNTATANHGNLVSIQTAAATVDTVTSPSNSFLAGVNTSYNWATRHTASAMNLAVAGTAATENSTPVALSDLSSASCELGLTYRGTIALFRQWDADLTDAGIEEASA